jgi:hypothetical protein
MCPRSHNQGEPQVSEFQRRRLRIRYNPAKGLAGQTLADGVNFLAVAAGLGAAPEMEDAFAWFWAASIVIGALTLGVAFFQWRRGRQEVSGGTWHALALGTAIVGVFTIAASVVAFAGSDFEAGFVGYPAFLAWILTESVNADEKWKKRPMTKRTRASLSKSLCQMLGALVIWVYLALTLGHEPALIGWLFWSGSSLALLGTVLGMGAGLANLRQK